MLRLLVLCLLIAAVAIPSCSKSGTASDDASGLEGVLKGRDMVIVVADSLHAGHLGTYGYERETSPYLDRLAAMGLRSERALSQTSWTLSSVTSLFTGLMQEAHGVLTAESQLPPDGPGTLAESFRRAGYRTVGLVQNGVVAPHTGVGRGFDRYEYLPFNEAGTASILSAVRDEQSAAEAPDAAPLFLYVHYGPPHMPYQPPAPFQERFVGEAPSGITGTIQDCAQLMADRVPEEDPRVTRLVELYDAHVAYADDLLRLTVEPFLVAARAEDTAVLFTSDHGEAFMQHGAIGHNAFCYEEMVNIPWVLAGPGALPEGAVLRGPTSLMDTFPTLAELFDLRYPGANLDGVSLAGGIGGLAGPEEGGGPARDAVPRKLFLSSRYPSEGKAAQFALVDGPWKLVTRRRGAAPQLFDLREDPREARDLTSLHPERAADMAREIAERRADLAKRRASGLTAPLEQTMLRDLEALGYGGEAFDSFEKERR